MRRSPSGRDRLMPIGMFSRASLVSIKSLRAYHAQGLLVPAHVDPASGYRSYHPSQLIDAQISKRLRDLDVPLRDVAEVMTSRDPAITRKVLAEHELVMRERLADLARIVDELQVAGEQPGGHTPVRVRVEPATHALTVAGTADDDTYAPFLSSAFERLFAAARCSSARVAGPGGALYPPELGDTDEVIAYLPIVEPVDLDAEAVDRGVEVSVVRSATCAVMTHVGAYDTIGDTYRRLGAWVVDNATSADQQVRERYVVSLDETTGGLLPDDRLQTEICWPITPEDHNGPYRGPERKEL